MAGIQGEKPAFEMFKVLRGGFRCEKGQKKSNEDKSLRRHELEALLKAARDGSVHGSAAYDLFALTGNLGLRSGEAITCAFSDFSYLQSDYLIVHTLKKRGKMDDRIYVGREEKALLLEIRDRRRRMVRGELLFPFGTRTTRHYFAYYAQKAGIHPNVSFHSLRHTAARMILQAANKDLRFVRTRLRHDIKGESTLLYTIPTPEEQIAVADIKGAVR